MIARGWCVLHYNRWRNGIVIQTPAERFWSKVDKRSEDECWPWLAGRTKKGYGQFSLTHRQPIAAHRMAWLVSVGLIPVGLHVLHRCDNPPCCNVAHLFLGTNADNIADRNAKGRANFALGERARHAKLRADDVVEIRRLAASGRLNYEFIGNLFGIRAAHVRLIHQRKVWAHV